MIEKRKKKKEIKIGIIGNGAVGQTFSVMLASSGFDVEVAGRRQRGIQIDDSFVYEIKGDFGEKTYLIKVVKSVAEFTTKKDIIIVATRMFDTASASKEALSMLEPNGSIVTIQNWFSLDKVMKVIPSKHSISMTINFTSILRDEKVYVIDTGGIDIGVYDKEAYNGLMLTKQVLGNICEVNTTNDVIGFLMSRNVLNSVISLMGAVTGLRLGEFLKPYIGRKVFAKCIKEVVGLMKKMNIKILPYDDHLDYYKFSSKTISGFFYRREMINLLRRNNKDIKSSALDQIECGKKCELKEVLKTFMAYAKVVGVKFKYIKVLYQILEEIICNSRHITINNLKDKRLTLIGEKNDNRRNQKCQCASNEG